MVTKNKIKRNLFFCVSALSLWNYSFAGKAEGLNQTELALLIADTTNNESSKENSAVSNQEDPLSGKFLKHEDLINYRFIQFDFENTRVTETLLTKNNVHKVNLEQVALCDGLVFDISRPHIELVNLYSYLQIFNQSKIAKSFNKVLGSLTLNLEGQDLTNYNLSNANLKGANLSNANLSDSSIQHADLSNAIIININLTSCFIGGVNFEGAKISNLPENNTIPDPYDNNRMKKLIAFYKFRKDDKIRYLLEYIFYNKDSGECHCCVIL